MAVRRCGGDYRTPICGEKLRLAKENCNADDERWTQLISAVQGAAEASQNRSEAAECSRVHAWFRGFMVYENSRHTIGAAS